MKNAYTARKIAELLQQDGDTEASIRMVRYYTQIGLVPELELIDKKRMYTDKHLAYFKAIRTLNKTGKKLTDIQHELSSMTFRTIESIAEKSTFYTTNHLVQSVEQPSIHIDNMASVTFFQEVTNEQKEAIEQMIIHTLGGKKNDHM